MIKIDKEFKELIPALSVDEKTALEENIKKEGCRDALVLWGETLIDGHNRYEICTRLNIPYKTVTKDFESREDVIVWIIQNQFGRRNLSAYDRSVLALKMKSIFADKAKENQGTRTDILRDNFCHIQDMDKLMEKSSVSNFDGYTAFATFPIDRILHHPCCVVANLKTKPY